MYEQSYTDDEKATKTTGRERNGEEPRGKNALMNAGSIGGFQVNQPLKLTPCWREWAGEQDRKARRDFYESGIMSIQRAKLFTNRLRLRGVASDQLSGRRVQLEKLNTTPSSIVVMDLGLHHMH